MRMRMIGRWVMLLLFLRSVSSPGVILGRDLIDFVRIEFVRIGERVVRFGERSYGCQVSSRSHLLRTPRSVPRLSPLPSIP